MVYREIIAVCSQIHTKHINTLCGQNVELLNVKLMVRTMYFPNSWVLYTVLYPAAVTCFTGPYTALNIVAVLAHGLLLRVLTSSFLRG